MSELMDIIAEMNWDSIFEVIAGDNVGEEEVFDVMDIANDIFSENYLGSNIDLYLEDILYDLKKSCILDIDMYGINQCMLGDRDMIIANDPQQLLLPKFYKEVMNVFVVDAHYSDHHTRWLYEKR